MKAKFETAMNNTSKALEPTMVNLGEKIGSNSIMETAHFLLGCTGVTLALVMAYFGATMPFIS